MAAVGFLWRRRKSRAGVEETKSTPVDHSLDEEDSSLIEYASVPSRGNGSDSSPLNLREKRTSSRERTSSSRDKQLSAVRKKSSASRSLTSRSSIATAVGSQYVNTPHRTSSKPWICSSDEQRFHSRDMDFRDDSLVLDDVNTARGKRGTGRRGSTDTGLSEWEESRRPSITGRFRRRSIDVSVPAGPSNGRSSLASIGEVVNSMKRGGFPTEAIMAEADMRELASHVPSYRKGSKLELLYNSSVDNFNLRSFYKRMSKYKSVFLVVRDIHDNVFGCFTHDPWEPFSGYFGTDECFVFRCNNGAVEIFHATGKNTYFQLARRDHLAVGGGSSFAFFLHNDLKSGASRRSETFNNPPLRCSDATYDFVSDVVEAWRLIR